MLTRADLVLRPNGLGPIQFGATEEEALSLLSEILGSPSADTGWRTPGCGPNPDGGIEERYVSFGALSIRIDRPSGGDALFKSWSIHDKPEASQFKTVDGIGIGSTLDELKATYSTTVPTYYETLLGWYGEFDMGGVRASFVAESDSPLARVTGVSVNEYTCA